MHVEQGAGHQLRDPAALPGSRAQRAVVHGLDEVHVRVGEQRAHDPGDEVGGELPQVGVDEADDVPAGDQQRPPQHLALARQGGDAREDRVPVLDARSRRRGDLRRTVAGAGVHDHDLVDQRNPEHQLPPDHRDDVADRGLLVQGGEHHADRLPGGALRGQKVLDGPVPGGPGARVQPALDFFQHVRWLLCDPSRLTDDYLNRPGLRLQS